MTGDVALTGEKQRKGLELILDEINAAGGIHGVLPIKSSTKMTWEPIQAPSLL
jgi:ABC-type branched-subunit amino acid transport system substrate-binding protein